MKGTFIYVVMCVVCRLGVYKPPISRTHIQPPLYQNTQPTNQTAGEELCAKVHYLGSGGMELLVGGKLTVGFLSSQHTEADIGACVWMYMDVCKCLRLTLMPPAAPMHGLAHALHTMTRQPPNNSQDAGALPLLHLPRGRPFPQHALGPARGGGLRPQRAVSNSIYT